MKKIFFLGCIFTLFSLTATEKSRLDYLELIQKYPSLISSRGDATKGEIEILTDPQKMADIEVSTKRDVGLIEKDKYWIWINDAVRFPSGTEGVYGRILWVKALEGSLVTGVCVMPLLEKENKIVVNCNFRHATRSWEMELPRGSINPGEKAEDAARRETLEETGQEVTELRLLGSVSPDTGVIGAIVPIYLAKVTGSRESSPENSEAIEEVLALSFSELEQALTRGYLERKIRGEVKKIYCRDPFLTYALLVYFFNP